MTDINETIRKVEEILTYGVWDESSELYRRFLRTLIDAYHKQQSHLKVVTAEREWEKHENARLSASLLAYKYELRDVYKSVDMQPALDERAEPQPEPETPEPDDELERLREIVEAKRALAEIKRREQNDE